MFRDDHDAALARLAALEEELKRERADDRAREQRVAELEVQLAKARDDLRRAERELEKHRPQPPPEPVRPANMAPEQPSRPLPRKTLAVVVTSLVAVIAVAIIGGIVSTKKQRVSTASDRTASRVFMPDYVSGLLPEIRSRAQAELSGSRLVSLRAKGVTSDGNLHAQYGLLEAEFQRDENVREPEVDPDVPIGAAPRRVVSPLDKYRCITVKLEGGSWSVENLGGSYMCIMGETTSGYDLDPACSMRSIWSRAIAEGAPADAIAELRLARGSWHYGIDDQRLQFRRTYPDDCERAR